MSNNGSTEKVPFVMIKIGWGAGHPRGRGSWSARSGVGFCGIVSYYSGGISVRAFLFPFFPFPFNSQFHLSGAEFSSQIAFYPFVFQISLSLLEGIRGIQPWDLLAVLLCLNTLLGSLWNSGRREISLNLLYQLI